MTPDELEAVDDEVFAAFVRLMVGEAKAVQARQVRR
jgi:hypothetical protein